MNYTHSTLADILNVSDRTLQNHRKALEEKYSVDLATKQGRSTIYKDEYLGLIQLSLDGAELPETLTESELPAFTIEPTQASALAIYEPVTETRNTRALAPVGDVIDVEYLLVDVDTSAIEERTEQNLKAAKVLRSALSKVILNETAADATELKESIKAIYAEAVASARAEALKDFKGN